MLNYVSHDLPDLKKFVRRGGKDYPESAKNVEEMIEAFINEPKFILPDFGTFIFDRNTLPEGITITRLPFRKIVVEVPFPVKVKEDENNSSSTKRIIVAEEGIYEKDALRNNGRSTYRSVNGDEEPNVIKISICSYYDKHGKWTFQPYSVIIRIGAKSVYCEDDVAINKTGSTPVGFSCIPHPMLTEINDELIRDLGFEKYHELIAGDVGTEIRIIAEMLTILNCRNVSTQVYDPPEKLNKARVKNGKDPFFSYHVLVVGGDVISGKHNSASENDEDGYKVKQHLRRGHIRRLSDDHTIWVNQTVVAPGSEKGIVQKDYKLRK